jgi:1-acyl-sn-glycerol-3-phosphate acyltransferase
VSRKDKFKHHPSAYYMANMAMRLVSDFHKEGKENLPADGFLFTCNHLSYWDAVGWLAFTKRTVLPVTAKKMEDKPIGKLIDFFMAEVWIEQNSPDRQAIKQLLGLLKAGHAIGVAPEGTRSKTGALQKGQEGSAFLARKADVPLLPGVSIGTEKAGRTLRPNVIFRLGKPYRLPEKRISLEDDTTRIMCAIAALLPEEYQGVYKGHPMIEEMKEVVL